MQELPSMIPYRFVSPRLGRAAFRGSQKRFASNLDTAGRTPGFARGGAAKGKHGNTEDPSKRAQSVANRNTASSTAHSSSTSEKVAAALHSSAADNSNNLIAPVHIPHDPAAILPSNHASTAILANSAIVIQRQLEIMNVMVGFEQANKYVIMDGEGNHIGYLAEQDHGFGRAVVRQAFRTHRSFTTHVFDRNEREVLRFHRPFSWISSRISIYDALTDPTALADPTSALADTSNTAVANVSQTPSVQVSALPLSSMRLIGEAQQQWAPLRRKYNLFANRATQGPAQMDQFCYINEPFLSWDFSLLSEDGKLLGSVNRNFSGFAREIFTDTGVYALRMDSASTAAEPSHIISQTGEQSLMRDTSTAMTLDQRAVMLATAVSIDFDYFSRHSGAGGGGFMPLWFPMGGGAGEAGAGAGAAGAGAEAGAAGVGAGEGAAGAGALEGAGAGAVGRSAGGAILGEEGAGTAAGAAGGLAGYEAMQRGVYGDSQSPGMDDASPQASDQPWYDQQSVSNPGQQNSGEEVWGSGEGQEPFQDSGPGQESGGDGEGGVVGSILDWFND